MPHSLSVPEKHQLRIARDTLRMTDEGARIMGGPTKAQARQIIKRLTGKDAPSQNRNAFGITYRGVLGTIHREFPTKKRAEQWLRQIGRPELIRKIKRVEPKRKTREVSRAPRQRDFDRA